MHGAGHAAKPLLWNEFDLHENKKKIIFKPIPSYLALLSNRNAPVNAI